MGPMPSDDDEVPEALPGLTDEEHEAERDLAHAAMTAAEVTVDTHGVRPDLDAMDMDQLLHEIDRLGLARLNVSRPGGNPEIWRPQHLEDGSVGHGPSDEARCEAFRWVIRRNDPAWPQEVPSDG